MGRLIDFLLDEKRPDPLVIKPFIGLANDQEKLKAVQEACGEISARAQKFVSNSAFWRSFRGALDKALSAADKNDFTKSFLRLTEAGVLINRAEESEGLRSLKVRLALFPAVWMLGLLGFQVVIRFLQVRVLFPLFSPEYFGYLWAGMIGGTTIVLWGLVKHSVQLDFDRTYSFWYLLKPGIGAVMGVIAVLILKAGFLSVEGKIELTNPTPLILLAFVVGFSERFFIRILDRVITAIVGGDPSVSVQNLILPTPEPGVSGDDAGGSEEPGTNKPARNKGKEKGKGSGASTPD
jgi:hypothetical protein